MSTSAPIRDFIMSQGCPLTISFRIRSNGAYPDMSGFDIKSQVREATRSRDLIAENMITVSDGWALLTFPGSIPVGSYVYDVKITDGSQVASIKLRGALTVVLTATE